VKSSFLLQKSIKSSSFDFISFKISARSKSYGRVRSGYDRRLERFIWLRYL